MSHAGRRSAPAVEDHRSPASAGPATKEHFGIRVPRERVADRTDRARCRRRRRRPSRSSAVSTSCCAPRMSRASAATSRFDGRRPRAATATFPRPVPTRHGAVAEPDQARPLTRRQRRRASRLPAPPNSGSDRVIATTRAPESSARRRDGAEWAWPAALRRSETAATPRRLTAAGRRRTVAWSGRARPLRRVERTDHHHVEADRGDDGSSDPG